MAVSGLVPSVSLEPASLRRRIMKAWRKPKTIEIAVGTEINAYACAAL